MITGPPAIPPRARIPLWTLGTFGFVVALVLGVRYAGSSHTAGLDALVLPVVDRVEGPLWYLATAIDFAGEPVGAVVVIALFGWLCLRHRRPRIAILTVAASGVTVALTTGLKPLVGRLIHGEFLSYPSGHTAFAVTVAAVVGLLVIDVRGLGPVGGALVLVGLVAFAGLAMGWAEVALGAHYPTDTFGGFGVAVAVVPVVGWAVDRLTRPA
ncbi:phosphatase PAP2 family protein [Amycolatopsis sp. EV170708-02-1]|uniref:phosphatase PAP2 family protein n=1 Tax=Amycolatopsis sp. EV170708-02-1 TaxID=2919322 RepID=UPI001F0CA142|nr:phosphatase PAP2 family protein [Amycolatopsis sp. EV170708-02-1]UMP02278.1 phosphatase PAP2 family protein [Amycolatopsis sp. EV170708-02-1]